MRWTDELRMETPEQIDLNLELAGLGSRFVAVVVDWLLKALLTLLVLVAVAFLASLDPMQLVRDQAYLLIALVVAGLGTLWLGYSVFFEVRWNGQTPGKSFARIRTIREGGAPVDFQAAGIRNLLTVLYAIPVFYILDAILILATTRHQRLGDMAAGTVVIRERAIDLGAEPEDVLLEHASAEYAFTPSQLSSLTANDRTVLREFLRRYDGMDARNRSQLAHTLAAGFATKTGYRAQDGVEVAESRTFLASLLRDLQEFLKHR